MVDSENENSLQNPNLEEEALGGVDEGLETEIIETADDIESGLEMISAMLSSGVFADKASLQDMVQTMLGDSNRSLLTNLLNYGRLTNMGDKWKVLAERASEIARKKDELYAAFDNQNSPTSAENSGDVADLEYDAADKDEFESNNSELISCVDDLLRSSKDPDSWWIEELNEEMVNFQRLSAGIRGRYRSNTYFSEVFLERLNSADEMMREMYEYVQNKDPMKMGWPELAAEISFYGLDINVHEEVGEGSIAERRLVVLYRAFMDRRGRPESESYQDRIERIHWSTYIQLSKLEDKQNVEGEMPTCTRSGLEEQMEDRQIDRSGLLVGILYHPDYGEVIRGALVDLIYQVADPSSPISYDKITSGSGRTEIKAYIRDKYRDQIKEGIFEDLEEKEQKRMTNHLVEAIWKLYFAFDLLTVSFAELQKNTKTLVHGTKNKGKDVRDLDWVFISRPDAGLVHRLFRYDTTSDWSANYLPFLKEIPEDYGRSNRNGNHPEEREKLVEIQDKLLELYNALFDAGLFSGENGIDPTDLFEPLFPDMFSFLTLAPGELIEIGEGEYFTGGDKGQPIPVGRLNDTFKLDPDDEEEITIRGENILTKSLYFQAIGGWNSVLEMVLGELPDPVSHKMILESTSTDKSDTDLGLIDQFIKSAGVAKVFKGEHLKRALVPFLTNYILRIFARYDASEKYRKNTFRQLVNKLRQSALNVDDDKAGLGDYRDEIEEVIARISKDPNNPGAEMSDSLRSGIYSRRRQRKKYVNRMYREDNKQIPTSGLMTWVKDLGFDKVSSAEEQEYWDIINGKEPLPPSGVERKGSLVRIEEESSSSASKSN